MLRVCETPGIVARVNLLALALAATLALLAPSVEGAYSLRSESFMLDNGLRVVLHRDHTVPLVAVRVLYRVGSADDPPGKQGMVHLMEHALFHGSEHVEGPVRSELARMAAVRSNGTTTPDFMQLYELVPSDNLAAALRLEADRMGFYAFDSSRIGTEKLIVNREMAERGRANGWAKVRSAARRELFEPSHPLHPASAATMGPISVPDLEALAEHALAPNNAVLALAGDLPLDTRELVERYFADLRAKEQSPAPPRTRVTLDHEVRVSVDGGHDEAPRALIAWHAPLAGDADEAIAWLTAAILARRLRGNPATLWRHNAAAATSRARYSSGLSYGEFSIGASAQAGTSPSALVEDLDDNLAAMVSDPPTQRELAAARKWMAVSVLRQMETLEMRAEVLAESAAYGQRDVVMSRTAAVERVTPRQVAAFVRDQLIGQPGRVVVLQYPGGGK